jgi:thiamine-phosphate pyrophosphorylase
VADRGGTGGKLGDRRLYLCTPDRPDLADFLRRCVAGGVDVVQLRDKVLDARPVLERAAVARDVCADAGVPFVLNDRPDLALEVGADGVHVGQDDAPPSLCRRILGDDAIVGFSTHAPAELDAAAGEPVDYVSTGPVHETPTKAGRPGTGLDYLRHAAATTPHPFFVTGGVSPATLPAMLEAGARRFVVVRHLTEADDPEAAARALRRLIDPAWA